MNAWLQAGIPLLKLPLFSGERSAGQWAIYGTAALVSLVLLVGCFLFLRHKRGWFVLLFSCVTVVNVGYTLLSLATCLEAALWFNRLAYFGSVFLPLAMLMILLNETGTKYKKRLPILLLILATLVFLMAASQGFCGLYYENVTLGSAGGTSFLIKDYGPLHPIYLFYLLGYFAGMVAVVVRAAIKKNLDSIPHAVFLTVTTLFNLAVWFFEQIVSVDFEMLSLSYIISEVFLLGFHLVVTENRRLKALVQQKEKEVLRSKVSTQEISDGMKETFLRGLDTLTPTERTIYEAYLSGASTKEILERLNIRENTLKFHNKNLYGKLGVCSRKQLIAVGKQLESISLSEE